MKEDSTIYEIYPDYTKYNDGLEKDSLYKIISVKFIEEVKKIVLKLSLYNNIPYKYRKVELITLDEDYINENRLSVIVVLDYSNTIQDNGTNFYIKNIKTEPYISYNQRKELGINTSISTNHEYLVSYPYKKQNHNPEFIFIYNLDKRLETYEEVMKEAQIYSSFIFSLLLRNDKPFKEFIDKCLEEYTKE